ncbi:MAG: shikimate dehydrogenase [Alphaproteobacteria bacterium]
MKAAVVGHPIAHSQSPTIHGHWLEASGIAGTYEALDLHPDTFASDIRSLVERGFQGVNATVPHKEAALALADTVDDTARRIGASNTLVFSGGKIEARNTDAYGFWENLAPGLKGQTPARALILGAGGAARAVLVALQDAGVGDILLANRTLSRAEALADELADSARIEALSWDDAEALMDREAFPLIVNTSSRGMKGDHPIVCALSAQGPETVVNDIVYNPLQTTLLQTASERGCTTVDGLGMLLHQARPAFEAFFGARVSVDAGLRHKVERGMGLV